jgi:uncharacterized protein YjbI with pentapeptide repeats
MQLIEQAPWLVLVVLVIVLVMGGALLSFIPVRLWITMDGCNFAYGNLANTVLSGCRLTDNRMIEAILDNARLDGADLRGSDLSNAHGRGMSLGGADLRGATINNLDPREIDLTGVRLDPTQALALVAALGAIVEV